MKNSIWYTADWHIFHGRMLQYYPERKRWVFHKYGITQLTVNNMNNVIMSNIVGVIGNLPGDLYVLGDVSISKKDNVIIWLEKLQSKIHNCNLHLIVGNHDSKKVIKWDGWKSVSEYKLIYDRGIPVVLFHYPIESWHGMPKGAVHLHGHQHGKNKQSAYLRKDVGIDLWATPVTLDDIGFRVSHKNKNI